MIHRYSTLLKAVNLLTDFFVLNIALIFTYNLIDNSGLPWIINKRYLPIVLIFNLLWLLSANLTQLYNNALNRNSVSTFRGVSKTYILFTGLVCISILLVIGPKAYSISRKFLFYSLSIFGLLIGTWKLMFLTFRYRARIAQSELRNIAIIGAGRAGNDLYNFIINHPESGYKFIGYFENGSLSIKQATYLGNIDDCVQYIRQRKVNEILCALPAAQSQQIEFLMVEADKNLIRFKLIPEFHYKLKPTIVEYFGHIPLISIRSEPLESIMNRFIKRCFDLLFSFFVIVFVFSWLMPIIALIIKTTSPGPVFFIQRRSGRNNKAFNCYKFRSMQVNIDSDTKQATKGDNRITAVGAFLRKTNLDELPQFFNVFKGNMTIVGPRPHMLRHTEEYGKLIDQFMVRHFLKPGITGWAQINGLRGETKTTDDMRKRVEADVWYLENWSFLLDLKIIFLTFYNTLKGDKNAF